MLNSPKLSAVPLAVAIDLCSRGQAYELSGLASHEGRLGPVHGPLSDCKELPSCLSPFPAASELFTQPFSVSLCVPLPKPLSDLSSSLHPSCPCPVQATSISGSDAGPRTPSLHGRGQSEQPRFRAAHICLMLQNPAVVLLPECGAKAPDCDLQGLLPTHVSIPTGLQAQSSQFLKEVCGLSPAVNALSTSLPHKLLLVHQEPFEMSPSR